MCQCLWLLNLHRNDYIDEGLLTFPSQLPRWNQLLWPPVKVTTSDTPAPDCSKPSLPSASVIPVESKEGRFQRQVAIWVEGREIDHLFLTWIPWLLFLQLLLEAFDWLVWKKGVDFRDTAIWHGLRTGLMPRWVSVGLTNLVGEGREERKARPMTSKWKGMTLHEMGYLTTFKAYLLKNTWDKVNLLSKIWYSK